MKRRTHLFAAQPSPTVENHPEFWESRQRDKPQKKLRHEASPEEWLAALNRSGIGQKKNELQGQSKALLTGESIDLQTTTQEGEYCLRISIASEATLRLLVAFGTGWDVQVALTEGAVGAIFNQPPNQSTFTVPRIKVPVKGISIAIHANEAYAQVINQSGVVDAYSLSAAFIHRRVQYDEQRFSNNSGGDAPFAEFTTRYTVNVPGGVTLGDVIEEYAYDGTLLATYPAREGIMITPHLQGATARYVPLAGVIGRLTWTFFRRV